MKIHWKNYSLQDYPESLWFDWDRLNQKYNNGHPMLDSRFVKALLHHFLPNRPIKVLAGYAKSEVIALLFIEEKSIGIARAYLPSQSQIALSLVPNNINPESLNFQNCLPFCIGRVDCFAIDPQYQSLLALASGANLKERSTNIIVDLKGSFEDYWDARSSNLKKNITRYRNRISKEQGSYSFKVNTKPDEIEHAVAQYGFIESRGWKGLKGTAIHPGNSQGNFYKETLNCFAQTKQTFVFELYFGETLVASRLCIYNPELLIILKTTYDEDYKKYATGRILLFEMIKYLFDSKPSKVIDFYTNATKEQLGWSTQKRTIYDLSIYRSPFGSAIKLLTKLRQISNTSELNKCNSK